MSRWGDQFKYFNSMGTEQVHPNSGILEGITITESSGGTIVVYDGVDASDEVPAQIVTEFPVNPAVGSYYFGSICQKGIRVVVATAALKFTLTYRNR